MRLRATLLRPGGGLRPLVAIIKDLFANNEQGVWYDPSDLSTLYQDAAGTIPVTAVEQPVGLMLDKSRGLVLGSELVTNGDFSQGATGWTVVNADATHIVTFAGGSMRYQSDTTTPALQVVTSVGTLPAGKTYQVEAVCSKWASGSVKLFDTANGTLVVNGVGKFTARITAQGGTQVVILRSSANVDLTLDSISVHELPGNHASQTTATSRPVLSARVNLLTKTEDFAHSDWANSTSFACEAAADPNGGNTATKIVSIGALSVPARDVVATANSLDFVLYLKPGTILPQILIRNRTTATGLIPLSTISTSGSNQYGSWVVTPVSDGWVKFKITLTSGFTVGNVVTLYYGATGQLASGLYWYMWRPDIRPTNIGVGLPEYQRVNTVTDYDTVGFPRIERFDAVDDVQNITFPVSLGSNCTVARVAQGGAVTILTGQTIGTSYQINQSHAGLIVVNRALTQSETNAVTRYFQNKGSGK